MKTCTKCRESKAPDAFSKDARSADGLYSSCKSCNAARYAENADHVRARQRAYRAADPVADRKRCAAWRKANPAKFRAAVARWEAAHPERMAESQAKHHAAHPDSRRVRNAKWQKANAASVAASKARRRARVLNAPGAGVTTKEWRGALSEAHGHCAYCGERTARLEMDHVEPLSHGGSHDIENVAPVCLACNRSKSDTSLVVFLARRAARRARAA